MGDAAALADDEPITVHVIEGAETTRMVDGALEIDQPDGGVIVQFNPSKADEGNGPEDLAKFYDNIADKIGDGRLLTIAAELHEAIEADDNSRKVSLSNQAKGMDLMGLSIEDPKAGDGAAAMDGMSVVTNPLLLDAVLKGWANAQAEFLPADGPCKIEDFGDEPNQEHDDLADAFERDMNYFLTTICTEYAPETSHMLLWGTFFGGSGFKKVFMDPMKSRPTSQKVDSKNLIVSDATTDLKSCERITHQIPMRQSVMKRMQMKGFYRDVALTPPSVTTDEVSEKIAEIQGVTTSKARPEDQPYTLWETQCELDLDEFAPSKFKGKGISLPYLVTMDKDTMQILAVRRDWKPEDDECERKRMYVKYPYVPGPGFYGTGLLNILGNSTAAMTAAWRICLDSGMLAAFPGFLVAKLGGRQNTSDMTVSPATGTPIETNGMPIRDIVMDLPYKEAGPGLMGLIDKITEQAKAAGASAEIPVGEGIQNVPVGTMLAHIETATKLMAATHKGMHGAQDEELGLIADLFRENPESFWKGNARHKRKPFWDEAKLMRALDTVTLVPKSDPNIPSHIHRTMKAVALVELKGTPLGALLDAKEVLKRVLNAMREDQKGLLLDPPPPNGKPSPEETTADAKMLDAQTKAKKLEIVDAPEMASKAQLEQQKSEATIKGKTIDLARTLVTHEGDEKDRAHQAKVDNVQHGVAIADHLHGKEMDHKAHDLEERKHGLNVTTAASDAALGAQKATVETAKAFTPPKKARGGSVSAPPSDMEQILAALSSLAEKQSAPRRIVRDENNRPVGVEIDHGNKVEHVQQHGVAPRDAPLGVQTGGSVSQVPPSNLQQILAKITDAVSSLAETHSAPRRIVRDGNNRPVGLEISKKGDGDK